MAGDEGEDESSSESDEEREIIDFPKKIRAKSGCAMQAEKMKQL
jgi:hypothetical protein